LNYTISLREMIALHVGKWVSTAALALWLSLPASIAALIAFVVADFVTGLLASFIQKRVDSDKALRGFVRKCMLIGLVLILHFAEGSLGREIGVEKWLSAYFIVIEVISIIENCAKAGIPIPALVVDGLLKVRELYPRTMTAREVAEAFRRADRQREKTRAQIRRGVGGTSEDCDEPPEPLG
jgi:toxin secretion/phage lysis holin